MKRCIGLVYDLRDDYLAEGFSEEAVAEFDSIGTIEALESAVRELGFEPERVGHARALCRRLVEGARWDLVLNIAEGVSGRSREAQAPALLELFDQSYTFSDPLTCAVTLDKAVCKQIVQSAGIATPRFLFLKSLDALASMKLDYPVFVKPVAEGTGKGVDGASRIESFAVLRRQCGELLKRFPQGLLIEDYLPGREFTAGVLGTGSQARALGTMEIRMRPHCQERDYSYEVKERCEDLVEYLRLGSGEIKEAVERMALAAHRTLQCRDTSRVDIRLDADGIPSFMEINPIPGLHPTHSDLPMIATQEGMTHRELIGAILNSAFERAGAPGERLPL